MKIVKNNIIPNPPKKSYPYFGRAKSGVVVLFTRASTGMVIEGINYIPFQIETEWTEEIFELIPNYSITITTDE
jgi:hypothetical protein